MIIICENCQTTFQLDEDLLAKEGSKVRCSLCKHVFLAYPPLSSASEQEFEETVALDSPPLASPVPMDSAVDGEVDFDQILEESLEEDEASIPSFAEDEEAVIMEEIPGEELREVLVGGEPEGEETELSKDAEMEVLRPARKKSGKTKPLLIVLVIILLLFGGVVSVRHWTPQWLPEWAPRLFPDFLSSLAPMEKKAPTDEGIRRLSFKAVTGAFMETKKAGRLFVVKGIVTNGYTKSRRFILVQGTILDDKGKVVRKKLAYAGNSFTKEQIDKMSLVELEHAMKNNQGVDGRNAEIPPDGSIPFMIIFQKLPENLSEFTVEAIRSSPMK